MQRYFVNEFFEFSISDIHHIKNVMRMKKSDRIICICDGVEYLTQIVDIENVRVEVLEKLSINNESPVKITLIQSIPKKENFELILQKSTELGVHKIIPMHTSRTIVKFDRDTFIKKNKRFEMILKEASEQSGRQLIPILSEPIDFKQLSKHLSQLNIIAYEKEVVSSNLSNVLRGDIKSITVVVGPEGGFSQEEIEIAKEMGFQSVSLGRRILRVETASIYILSVLASYLEV